MHEYPLTLSIIEIASRYATEKNSQVTKINLLIGEASGILGESIRLYFNEIALGTLCENAKIEIEWIKPLLKCNNCGLFFHRKPFSFACPNEGCTGEGFPTDIGQEFYVKSIELEK